MNQLCKKHWLLLCLSICCLPSLSAQKVRLNTAVLDDALEDIITNEPSEYLRAYVLLKDQVDIVGMTKQFDMLRSSKDQRARAVVSSLKSKASNSQADLKKLFYNSNEVEQESITPFWVTNMILIEAKGAFLANLSYHPQVERIEQEIVASLFKTEGGVAFEGSSVPNGREEGLTSINAHKLWEMGYTGYGTKVLVIDTEIDVGHRALRTQFLYNNEPLTEVSTGGNINGEYIGSGSSEVCLSHGTYVAGVIVGLDRQRNDTVGGAFNAKYLQGPVPFFDENGDQCQSQGTTLLNDIQNLQFALDPDGNPNTTSDIPDVINNSYGTSGATSRDCQSSIYRNVFSSLNAAGISLVFATGNEGPDAGSMSIQTSVNFDPLVPFSVGAVDDNNVIASFSSRGPSICQDGPDQFEPEVVAPGVSVRTTKPFNLYESIQGTSFSAPYVSGAILLLKEAFPNLSGRTLNEALYETANDLGTTGEDNVYGNGFINVFAAYNWLIAQGNTPTPALRSSNDVILVGSQAKNIDCGRMIQPFITVANNGTEVITEMDLSFLDIDRNVNLGTNTWNGRLSPGELLTFEVDPINAIIGSYPVQISINKVNGRADLRSLDNVMKINVNVTANPTDPSLTIAGAEICKGGQSMLQASSDMGGTIRWYDAFEGGSIVAEGPSLFLQDIQKDTSLFVSVTTPNHVGLEKASDGPNTFLNQQAGLVFDAYSNFTLKSVKIFAESAGPRIIQLKDERGNVQQRVIPISTTGEVRVDLDFVVEPGTDYELLMTLGNGLSVTTNQTGFPHEIEGILSITRSTGTVASFYAYFYDWEIEYDYICGRVSANIRVNEDGEAPDVDFSVDKEIVTLDQNGEAFVQFMGESNDLVTYKWSFGDGFTSIQPNPTNIYRDEGTYIVTLYGTNAAGCSNMAVKIIEVKAAVTSTEEQRRLATQVKLFPNPAKDQLNLQFNLPAQENVAFKIIDILGKVHQNQILGKQQETQTKIDIDQLPAGTYLVMLTIGDVQIGKRFIKK